MIRFWHYFYLFVKFLTSLFSKYLSFKLHPEILTVAVTAAKIHCPLLFCFVCLFFFLFFGLFLFYTKVFLLLFKSSLGADSYCFDLHMSKWP